MLLINLILPIISCSLIRTIRFVGFRIKILVVHCSCTLIWRTSISLVLICNRMPIVLLILCLITVLILFLIELIGLVLWRTLILIVIFIGIPSINWIVSLSLLILRILIAHLSLRMFEGFLQLILVSFLI